MYRRKILLGVVLGGLLAAGIFAYMVYRALFSPNTRMDEEVTYIYIPSDASFATVRSQIDPLLINTGTFEAVARRKKYTENIRPGKYAIRSGMSNNEIINTLRSANLPVTVSFNNQETLADLAGRVASELEADSVSLLEAMEDTSYLKSFGLNRDSGIALFIPNSYEFFWNTSAEGFRDRMQKEYERFWNESRREKASKLGLTPLEVTTLASVVHKETAKVEERPRVAGVYLNRLKRNMPLQADPTVIYAIKHHSGNFDTIIKRVLYRDLELDSPYNTYKYSGIPPGPITMPDISAVDAILNAEDHDYLYFVADVENFGYHIFAETLAQHNRNKAQYIRWINEQNIKR